MAAVSKLEKYRVEIKDLMEKEISIRSAWKIINFTLPKEGKMSYSTFYHYVTKHILST